ncbi:hypothetical protein KVP08_023555 (plasmid) [Shewanella putrefaciens]|nr:hypothetical protein KVP08_023555 [Shewanella putrefaciens]
MQRFISKNSEQVRAELFHAQDSIQSIIRSHANSLGEQVADTHILVEFSSK